MAKAKGLHISSLLSLPIDAVTATQVVYGGKGMGKTNYGAVLVEELAAAGLRFSVIDPMGVWWGIRHSADGTGNGVECLILGGAHGDIPIEPTGGAVIADLVADHRVNVIIDISRKANGEMWSIGERIRFVTDYGRQLFKRQGGLVSGQRREPILQVMDEAARFIPQVIRSGDIDAAKCESVWSTIVEEGRNVGLGVLLLTQRSARLNKNVAELADVMMAFRTVGPNSVNAVMDWLGEHIPKTRTKEIVEQLRSLARGSALVVSPGWLQLEKIVPIRMRHTFDSSATPKPGEKATKVRGNGAKPNLALYAERMAETIERAKAEDPKALQAKVKELESRLAKGTTSAGVVTKSADSAALAALRESNAELKRTNGDLLGKLADRQRKANKLIAIFTRSMRPMVEAFEKALEDFKSDAPIEIPAPVASFPTLEIVTQRPPTTVKQFVPKAQSAVVSDEPGEQRPLGGVAMKIAGVAAGYAKRREGISKKLLATLCGTTMGGTFSARMSEARSAGAITTDGTTVYGTEWGMARYGNAFTAPSTTDEVVALWRPRLGGVSTQIFDYLVSLGGQSATRAQIAEAVGATMGGTFSARLSEVRSTGLLVESGNTVAMNRELLFL